MDERPSNYQILRCLEGEADDEGFRKFFNQVKSGLTTKEKEDLLLSLSWEIEGIISIKGGSSSYAGLLFMDGTTGFTVKRRCYEESPTTPGVLLNTWQDRRVEPFDKKEKQTIYKKYTFPVLISLQSLDLPALQTILILENLFPVTSLLNSEFVWNLVLSVKHNLIAKL